MDFPTHQIVADSCPATPHLQVVDRTGDLAVADRIAYVLAHHSSYTHVVLADGNGYAIARAHAPVDVAQAVAITLGGTGLHILSIADGTRITPILLPAA